MRLDEFAVGLAPDVKCVVGKHPAMGAAARAPREGIDRFFLAIRVVHVPCRGTLPPATRPRAASPNVIRKSGSGLAASRPAARAPVPHLAPYRARPAGEAPGASA